MKHQYRVTETRNGEEHVVCIGNYHACDRYRMDMYETDEEEEKLQVKIQKETSYGWTTDF